MAFSSPARYDKHTRWLQIHECTLSGSGVTSGCTFTYTPTYSAARIDTTYHPTSNHQSESKTTVGAVASALDQTQTIVTVPSAHVHVGEPSECDIGVLDLSTRAEFLPNLVEAATTALDALGTFSAEGASPPARLQLRRPTRSVSCGTLFRSGARGPQDQTTHTVWPHSRGTSDYDLRQHAAPAVVTVGAPTVHPVKVDVTCDRGV